MDDEKPKELPFDPNKRMFQCKDCETFLPGAQVTDIQQDPRSLTYHARCTVCKEITATIMKIDEGDPGAVPRAFGSPSKRMQDLTIVLEKVVLKMGTIEKELRTSNEIEKDRLEFNQWKDMALSIVSKWLRSKKTHTGQNKNVADFMRMLAENSPEFREILTKLKKGEGDGNPEAGGSGVGEGHRGAKRPGKAGDKQS